MGIERSMMTIVAKSPGNVNSESKQLSPAGVFSQQTWRCHQENAKYLWLAIESLEVEATNMGVQLQQLNWSLWLTIKAVKKDYPQKVSNRNIYVKHCETRKPGNVVKPPSTGRVRPRIKAHNAVVLGNFQHPACVSFLEVAKPAKVDHVLCFFGFDTQQTLWFNDLISQ